MPTPGRACREALYADCGKDKKGEACITCADAHKAQLEKDNCTSTLVHEFCEPAPPAPTPEEKCARAEEEYCGGDRHNHTMCARCITAHAALLKNASCTEELEAKFCIPPKPPSPTAECYQTLKKYCEADRKEHSECVACVGRHENETRAAHCTYTQVEAFCSGPAPPPAKSCDAEMDALCAKGRAGGETACTECMRANAAALAKADCDAAKEEAFCKEHPHPPAPPGPPHPHPEPTANCTKEFDALCGNEHKNASVCLACADEHKAVLESHGCTHSAVDEMCHVHPHPPTPPGPHPHPEPGRACYEGMETSCSADRHNATRCRACITEHAEILKKDNCTTAEEDEFCHPPAPPAPSTECAHVLVELCEADKKNATLCRNCLRTHENQTRAAHCTYTQLEAFCEAPKPPVPPQSKCEKVLADYCETDRRNATLCHKCVESHASETKAAGCTVAEEAKFCEAPPAPPHHHTCTAEQYCCPDAKHCLTPVAGKSCAAQPTACGATETCCPLTKMCVKVGLPCHPTPTCKTTEFCCPDAKACLTPVAPGTFCKETSACKTGAVCCPLIKQCVTASAKCEPFSVPAFLMN